MSLRDLVSSQWFGVLLGGLLTMAGGFISNIYIQNQTYQRQVRENKYAVLTKFSENFEKSVTHFMILRLRQIWEINNKDNPDAKDELGRPMSEIIKWLTYVEEEYVKNPIRIYPLFPIDALFEDKEVLYISGELQKKADYIQRGDISEEQIRTTYNEIITDERKLIQAMKKEIKS